MKIMLEWPYILVQVLSCGDSLITGLSRYEIWDEHFKPLNTLNCGIKGDKVKHVTWRMKNFA